MQRTIIAIVLGLMVSLGTTLAVAATTAGTTSVGCRHYHQPLLDQFVQDNVLSSEKAEALGKYFAEHCPALRDNGSNTPLHQRHHRSERAEEHGALLDNAVKAGVLTAEERNAVYEYWLNHCPLGQGQGMGRHGHCPAR